MWRDEGTFWGENSAAGSKCKVFAVIIRSDDRSNRMIAEIRDCIHVSDKAQLLAGFISSGCRNMSIDIAMFIYIGIFHTQFLLIPEPAVWQGQTDTVWMGKYRFLHCLE